MQSRTNSHGSGGIANYDILGTLGTGAYGEVVLATKKDDITEVAIKILDKKFLAREKKQYQVFIEREVLQRIDHPGVIKMFDFFQSQEKIYFVVEFSRGGDFANFLKLNSNHHVNIQETFSFKSAQFYVAEIVCQLEVLHSAGIAHRDVKPENLLLTQEGHLKMIDFGTASFFDPSKLSAETLQKLLDLKEMSRKDERGAELDFGDDSLDDYQSKHKATFVGTAEYVSPELLEDDICGPEADLWALGCIVYKMFTGKTPFSDSTEYLVFQKIKSCQLQIPDNIRPEALSLISKLLLRDPTARLGSGGSFADLKKHSFFQGIDFSTLFTQQPPQDVKRLDTRKSSKKESSDEDIQSPIMTKSSALKSKIMMSGLIDKKVGILLYKARLMVIHDSEIPYITYFDPKTNVKKVNMFHDHQGEIQLKDNITIEMERNGFTMDVPQKKKYYFKQIEHPANTWVTCIKKLMDSHGIKCRLI